MWTKTAIRFAESSVWKSDRFPDREELLVRAVGDLRRYELAILRAFRIAYRAFLQDLERALTHRLGVAALESRLPRALLRLRQSLYRSLLAMSPEVMRAGVLAAQSALMPRFADAGIPDVPATPPDWYEWYEATCAEALNRYLQSEREDIMKLVRQAVDEGWTMDRLAAEIKDEIWLAHYWKAERVARTEVMRLFNLGHVGRLYNEPLVVGYQYAVVLDARTSLICRELAGRWVRKELLVRVPPFHPHCRTLLLPVFVGEEQSLGGDTQVSPLEQQQRAKQFGVIPRQVLARWAADRA